MLITDSKLKSLHKRKHDRPPIKYADRDGLYVFHRKTGRLTFVFRYRFDGKQQDMTIGSYPSMGLAKARAETLKYRFALEEGHNPKTRQQAQLVEQKIKVTVKEALEYWLEN